MASKDTASMSFNISVIIHATLNAIGKSSSAKTWTMVGFGTAVVSACFPHMCPVSSHGRSKSASNSEHNAEKIRPIQHTDPRVTVRHARSRPSLSVNFAHLGVLGNLDQEEKSGATLETIQSEESQSEKELER